VINYLQWTYITSITNMYIPRTACIIYMPEEATHGHTSPDIQSESIFVSARVHLATLWMITNKLPFTMQLHLIRGH